jgi:[protein-PII] uridylyltransferase
MASVSPDVLNDWKLNVLADLYHSSMTYLAGDGSAISANTVEQSRRRRVAEVIHKNGDSEWYQRQVEALPPAYLAATPPETIAEELERLQKVTRDEPQAWGRVLDDQQVLEFSVGAYPPTELGTFHRLTGALTSQGFQILSAQINTLADGLVLDRFIVSDGDHQGTPPQNRVDTVLKKLVGAVRGDANEPPTFRKLWQNRETDATFTLLPTRIQFDNDTSETYTVLDIFTHDRMGLLYLITRTLSEMGISIAVAKVGTYLDQVVDVFYITGSNGKKIEDDQQLARIRERLLEAIEEKPDK